MAELLKEVYSNAFIDQFLSAWKLVNSKVDKQKFKKSLFDHEWKLIELKARMEKIATCMHHFMPSDTEVALKELVKLTKILEASGFKKGSFEFMFLPNYIEIYGFESLKESLNTIERVTQFTSCEFAIRPFIKKHTEKCMNQLLSWSKHPDDSVRRLSSEGCRPRLPWAMALPDFKKDPSPILPILENLKDDESLYVRKSVANNLNDISKDNPDLVLKIASQWIGKTKNTDWIIKHGLRSLLKEGNSVALALFDYADNSSLDVGNIELESVDVKMNSALSFSFTLKNRTSLTQKVRLEYGIYFLKANGSLNRKVFKLSEKELKPKEHLSVNKKHFIKPISTRKYYFGRQELSLIINGIEIDKKSFELVNEASSEPKI